MARRQTHTPELMRYFKTKYRLAIIFRYWPWWIRQTCRFFWYKKVLGRKRDIVKDRDCRDFNEAGVNINKFIIKAPDGRVFLNELEYLKATVMKAPKVNLRARPCQGDGHYKCYECQLLNYHDTDLLQKFDDPAVE
jgi:hypothetical protein